MSDLPPPPPIQILSSNNKPKWKKEEVIQQSKSGKAVLILARYTFPFHNWVDENHLRVMIVPIEAKSEISGDIKKKFAHIEYVAHYESSGMVEFKAFELNKKYNFTHVCYQAEQDIIRAARLRELFGLKGQTVKNATVFRDKVTMKEHLSKYGLAVPKNRRVTSYLSVFEHIKENGYPVVCKPTCGMGSINTSIIKDEESLQKFLKNEISFSVDGPIDLEIENFAKGEMYHCDGLVYENQVKIAWVSKYINTCVGFLESNFLGSYTLQQDNPLVAQITDFAVKTLQSLNEYDKENNPILSYSFHVEVFYDKETSGITLCEAACRTGGAGVSDVMRYLFNVDLNKACVQSQCGDKPTSEGIPQGDYTTQKRAEDSRQCAGWLLMYPKVGVVKTIANTEKFDYVYSQSNSSRREFTQMAHCTDCLSQFIITGNNEEEIIKNITDTARYFTENTIYN